MSTTPQLKFVKKITIPVDTGKGSLNKDAFLYYAIDGTIEVRTVKTKKNEVPQEGEIIYSNNGGVLMTSDNWEADVIEDTIRNDDSILKAIRNSMGTTAKGRRPNFLTEFDIKKFDLDPLSRRVGEVYQDMPKDEYFDGNKSAKYPLDAIYERANGGNKTQDHLVISQYRYKPPRADDIWGDSRVGDILTQGITRNSPLDEFLGLVKMPMPNAIQDSNNVAWGEDTVNALEAAALNAVKPDLASLGIAGAIGGTAGIVDLALGGSGGAAEGAIATGLGTRLATSVNVNEIGGTILAPEAVARILGTLNIETSAEAILARKEGVVPNSNLELLFSGPTLRQFSFVYKMSPRSKPEAKIVNQILRFFKQGMAAKKLNSTGGAAEGRAYFLGTPNVFRLQYRTNETEAIKGLNRIKTCALIGTSVNYTPEGAFASYDKGQPVSVLLTLNFQELEPIYDTDYKYGGGDKDERQDDTSEGYRWKISKDEVGY